MIIPEKRLSKQSFLAFRKEEIGLRELDYAGFFELSNRSTMMTSDLMVMSFFTK